MTKEEVRFQVALSCIQGVLEAKHGMIGEILPSVAVAESLRIADEFVKQWFNEDKKEEPKKNPLNREKLMDKPVGINLENLYSGFKCGKEMHDYALNFVEAKWIFPEGVKEKIKDDYVYKVWYDFVDITGTKSKRVYTVYYIEL